MTNIRYALQHYQDFLIEGTQLSNDPLTGATFILDYLVVNDLYSSILDVTDALGVGSYQHI